MLLLFSLLYISPLFRVPDGFYGPSVAAAAIYVCVYRIPLRPRRIPCKNKICFCLTSDTHTHIRGRRALSDPWK